MSRPLEGRVCIVTGASRGLGKGIALQLGEAGAIVYITGRTFSPKKDGDEGSLQETAEEIERRGGKCIPVPCDHGNDIEIKQLFDKVKDEQNGRLDVLVNNAYNGIKAISDSMDKKLKFWEEDTGMWDTINGVGLRSHYLASMYAAHLMVPAKQGLIVNISAPGSMFPGLTLAYTVGKAGMDRMAIAGAEDLREHNIAFISLWPGAVKTEIITKMLEEDAGMVRTLRKAFELGETAEFSGKAIVHLAIDPNLMKKSGKIVPTSAIASEFGFTDIDGKSPLHPFSLKFGLLLSGHNRLGEMVPAFLSYPKSMIASSMHHFY